VGPHHSVVITGIARAGIDALIELAGACEQWRLCGGIRTFPIRAPMAVVFTL
jgi:hypothetical protein